MSRCCMSVMKQRSITSATFGPAHSARHALDLGDEVQIRGHRQVGVERRVLRAGSRCAGAPRGTRVKTSKPATRAVPPLAGMKQARIFIVVDLPAPLGPRKPTICPFVDVERHVVDGRHRPVALRQSVDLDHGFGPFQPGPSRSISHG